MGIALDCGEGRVRVMSTVGPFLGALLALRWIPVLLVILPLSRIAHLYKWLSKAFFRLVVSDPRAHDARVRRVQAEVRKGKRSGQLLCTARRSLWMTTMKHIHYKTKKNGVHIEMYDILSLDEKARLLRVEPLVTMEDLTRHLNPRGWTLPVVPELDDLTVGGLVSGYGIESSSHKHGLFFDNVESVDLVMPSGELVTASRDNEHSELFHSVPWSCGAVGFIVAVTLRIIPCNPFVQIAYTPYPRLAELVAAFEHESTRPNGPEFVEALVFSKERGGVLLTGEYSNNTERLPVNDLRAWNAKWFFKQVEEVLDANTAKHEAVPLDGWYHRHTASLFWEMELILPFGNSAWFRNLLGWLMPASISLLKLTHTESLQSFYELSHVAQDFLVPIDKLDRELDRVHSLFEVYPIWLCPHLVADAPGAIRARVGKGQKRAPMYVDVGVYGVSHMAVRGEGWHAPKAVAEFERWLIENHGYSALYAIVELTREQFDRMFDRELYNKVRQKWGAEGVLMDTYDKIK